MWGRCGTCDWRLKLCSPARCRAVASATSRPSPPLVLRHDTLTTFYSGHLLLRNSTSSCHASARLNTALVVVYIPDVTCYASVMPWTLVIHMQ